MKAKSLKTSLALFLVFLGSGTAWAALIDFEGMGLEAGDSMPTIGIASFIGDAGVQGTGYAFVSTYGASTGNSGSFAITGNTFITYVGGLGAGGSIEVFFATPVTDLQFDVADVDSGPVPHTIERMTATVYNSSDYLLDTIVHLAPTTGNLGDGEVVNIAFEELSGITKLQIQLDNAGTHPEAVGYGFGVDNIQFNAANNAVPIPSTVFLLGSGLVGLGAFRRMKKAQETPDANWHKAR